METRPAEEEATIEAALELRRRVFCEEQGVDVEVEIDGRDPEATHLVVIDGGEVIGTCRLLFDDVGGCKLGRMAVAEERRGTRVGKRLLLEAEAEARRQGAEAVVLHAQRQAEGFYAASGYRPKGETFQEDGIPHVKMTKRVRR